MTTTESSFKTYTEKLGDSLVPKRFRQHLQDYLRKASIYEVPYFKFGIAMYVVIVISLIVDIILMNTHIFSNTGGWGRMLLSIFFIPFITLLVLFVATYLFKLYLDIRIQVKISQMKECFPEFLSALALNMRIGGTLDMVLENSADKDFGVLSDEIKIVVKDIRMGATEDEAIKDFMNKYNIDVINDAFELILINWKKGGNTANLAERIYENMKELRYLRDKIIASVTNYRIFLTALAIVIAPAMFAMTYHLIDLIRKLSQDISKIPDSVALPFSINLVKINDAHFITFATLSVLLISISIAFIISVVKTGEAKHAYKQILLYAVLSFLSYQLFMILFGLFFSLFAV